VPALTPSRAIADLIADPGPAGRAVRTLLPILLLAIGVVGVVAWGGHRAGLLGASGAVAVLALGNAAILVFAVLRLGQLVRSESMARSRMEIEAKQGGPHDPVTNLANHGFFLDQLSRRLALAERRSSGVFAVFCLSLDGFGDASRRLDPKLADQMITLVADVIKACVRATDLVARLDSEKFAILIEELAEPRDVNILAQRLLAAVPQAIAEIDPGIAVSASIGIAFKAAHHSHASDLLHEADAALQLARSTGRGGYQLTG
jgi:diguanylate cyclase (GGDEF)-like protein